MTKTESVNVTNVKPVTSYPLKMLNVNPKSDNVLNTITPILVSNVPPDTSLTKTNVVKTPP